MHANCNLQLANNGKYCLVKSGQEQLISQTTPVRNNEDFGVVNLVWPKGVSLLT